MKKSLSFSTCSLQELDRPSFLLHLAKLSLWGRVSCTALRLNFRSSDGNFWTTDDHMLAALSSQHLKTWPWRSMDDACSSLFPASFLHTILFALFIRARFVMPGSTARASCAVSIGRCVGRCKASSLLVSRVEVYLTAGSLEASSLQA